MSGSRYPLPAFLPFALLHVLSLGGLNAQDVPAEDLPTEGAQVEDPLAMLATGDAADVAIARRWLMVASRDDVPAAALRQLLRSDEIDRRIAAATVLIVHGLERDAVVRCVADEADPDGLQQVFAVANDDLLAAIGAATTRPEVSANVAIELAARGVAEPVGLRAAWYGADAAFARRAMRAVLARSPAFPEALAAGLSVDRKQLLLSELVRRSRADARGWVDRLGAGGELGDRPLARLAVLLTREPDDWERADLAVILDALVGGNAIGDEPWARHLGFEALDRLGPAMGDRLVAEVHRRVVDGADFEALEPCLERISDRGEQFLAGLSRTLERPARVAAVEFLAERGSPHVTEHLAELVDDPAPLEAEIVRYLGPVLEPADAAATPRVDRLVDMLARSGAVAGDGRTESVRAVEAAFAVLVERGVWRDALIEFAVSDGQQLRSRARTLLRLSPDAIPIEAWRTLIEQRGADVAPLVLSRLAACTSPEPLELLETVAASSVFPASEARAAALSQAPAGVAQRVWAKLDAEARRGFAERVALRDEAWVLEALRAEPFTFDAVGLLRARITAGDSELVGRMIAEPEAWPEAAVRGLEDVVPPLVPGDANGESARRLRKLVAEPPEGEARARHFLRWLVDRPDLGGREELTRLWVTADDFESRYLALRGLARRPESRDELFDRVERELGDGLGDEGIEVALEVIGSLGYEGLDERSAGLLAKLAIVEPIEHARRDLERTTSERPLPGVPIAHLFARAFGESPDALAAPAVGAAVDLALAHPDVALLTRQRVGRLLASVAIDSELLATIGPALGRLILALPDVDRTWEGPSAWIVSERAAADGDLERALQLAERAAVAMLTDPPPPPVLRMFVGDRHAAARELPAARIAARPWILRARIAHAAGRADAARDALASARVLAVGDGAAEAEVATLQEILR